MNTSDLITAVWRADLQALVGTLQPRSYNRAFTLITITGPARSTLTIYRGYIPTTFDRITAISPAEARTYDAADSKPMTIRAGEAALFVWTAGNTSATATASASVISEVS